MHAILHAEDVVMVYGPPGTGKTTTLVESIFQKSKFQKKILVTASSNAATDLLAFKLDQKGLTVVRIGNIARISPENRHLSLEARIEASQEHKEIKKANIQKDALVKILHKYKSNSKRDYEQIKAIRSEIKILNQFIQHLSHSAYTEIIDKAQIIVSTLIGANHPKISSLHFDTLVIDEASQAMIPAALVAVSKADKVILAGDPHQLPPTVKSTKAQGLGLSQTFLDLVYQQRKNVFLLDTQYRMHPHIASISNKLFYEGALKHADYLQAYGIPQFGQTYPRILFIDTVASGFEELQSEQTLSISNPKEAYFTLHYIQNFINHLDLQDQNVSIAIISPYRGQVELMKTLDEGSFGLAKSHQISFDTIDSFQGQEREMVVLSLVRSNEEQIIGFLQDYRRLNVALTRAQKQLTIIGDSATIGGNKYYQNIIQEITKLDGYRSVYEFDFFSMIS
jgi:superfamily I DNA and/or RNA helicase